MISPLVACRKLVLVDTEVADATLAGVLQQLPLLTVRIPACGAWNSQARMHTARAYAALLQMACAANLACATMPSNTLQTRFAGTGDHFHLHCCGSVTCERARVAAAAGAAIL